MPGRSRVTIALVQMTCTDRKEHNVEKAISRIGDAAAEGANVVCLQELFAGTYPCQAEDHQRFDEAEPIPGPTSEAVAEAAGEVPDDPPSGDVSEGPSVGSSSVDGGRVDH